MKRLIIGNAFSLQMLDLKRVSTLKVEPLSIDEVKRLIKDTDVVLSAIGHIDTANVVGKILQSDKVYFDRASISLDKDTSLIVAQLTGGRLPEGAKELPPGFKLVFVKVTLE